jgi:hypothetical protein
MCRGFSWVLVLGFVIKASLVRAGENNLVRVAGYGIPAHYDVAVRIDLSAVDFHGRGFSRLNNGEALAVSRAPYMMHCVNALAVN